MRLYALLEEYAKTNLPDMEITGLTDDSRKVKPGMLFACIRGEHFDGHNAAGKALESGAAATGRFSQTTHGSCTDSSVPPGSDIRSERCISWV